MKKRQEIGHKDETDTHTHARTHATPHHTTPQHNTTHYTTLHHTTPHYTTPHHTTPHHKSPFFLSTTRALLENNDIAAPVRSKSSDTLGHQDPVPLCWHGLVSLWVQSWLKASVNRPTKKKKRERERERDRRVSALHNQLCILVASTIDKEELDQIQTNVPAWMCHPLEQQIRADRARSQPPCQQRQPASPHPRHPSSSIDDRKLRMATFLFG